MFFLNLPLSPLSSQSMEWIGSHFARVNRLTVHNLKNSVKACCLLHVSYCFNSKLSMMKDDADKVCHVRTIDAEKRLISNVIRTQV